MTQPRAADDFATIRARLQELRRERAETTPTNTDAGTEGSQPLRDAEKRSKERRDGSPPPWVPTIFVKRLTGP
jgi:hypothetical protein